MIVSSTTIEASTPEPAAAALEQPRDEQRRFRVPRPGYVTGKIVGAVVSFFFTLVIGFTLFNLMPQDPVRTLTQGHVVSPAQMAQLRHQFGLNESVWARFWNYIDDTVHLRFGYSWQYQQNVSTVVLHHLEPTLLLMGSSFVISVLLGMWIGARSGWRPGRPFDRINSSVALTLWSVPTFWLGMILVIVFGIGGTIGLFPTYGMSDPTLSQHGFTHVLDVTRHLVLPCLTMVLVIYAQYVTVMRSSIMEQLGSPYLLTARAKGLTDDAVRRRHAVPNALLPSVTMIFLQLGSLIGGAVMVETVFSWPGLGDLTFAALKIPDIPLLQGTFIIFSASVIVMNLLADIAYRFLDPRVRAS
jgi:peptide/nickel transport system permease protein